MVGQRGRWEIGLYTILRVDQEEQPSQSGVAVLSLSGRTSPSQEAVVQPPYSATAFPTPQEDEDEIEWQRAWGDVTGVKLSPKSARAAKGKRLSISER